jgi:hypothetical protein
MVGHVLDLTPREQRELLTLLTQERGDLQTEEEVLAELSDALRRQLSLRAATDLAEGFRRRMIRIAEELEGEDHGPGHYDFLSDRKIAEQVLKQVSLQAKALASGADGDFMADFTKSFRTMSQDRRSTWLREAALAASADEPDAAALHAAEAARAKASAEDTAARIAADVAHIAYRAVRKKGAARAPSTAPAVLGLVAGGAVAFAIRDRRKARDAAVQVRRERQATQAVVTTCAYVLAALDAA